MARRRQSTIRREGDVAHVELTQGKWATIDAADVPLVEGYAWYSDEKHGRTYAVTKPTGTRISMHRLILRPRQGYSTDHIDGDGLNNRRSNLREATHRQNMGNRRTQARKADLPRGVTLSGPGRYRAVVAGKSVGIYTTPEAAHLAYRLAAAERFGEFAPSDLVAGLNEVTRPEPAPPVERPPAAPTRPPVSTRFSDDELARIDAWARRNGLKRHGAIRSMVLRVVNQDLQRGVA